MEDCHAARPRLVVDNSCNIGRFVPFRLRNIGEKLKGDAFDPSGSSLLYDGGPEARRDAVPRSHGADVAVAGPDVFPERPGRGPGTDHFLKNFHRDGTIQNVMAVVNTKRSDQITTLCSVMETPATRLRKAREKTGHETAASFAKAHNLNPGTQRSRESGWRGYPAKVAKEYERFFRRYPGTRSVTAHWLLFGDTRRKAAVDPAPTTSVKADAHALIDEMTDEQVEQLWPWLSESAKLVKKAG